jgi:predicted glutamine amidotransferase
VCGIFGYIGVSTNPKASFDLINQLMIKTEPRGSNATGFWATTREKEIFYHKAPVKSSLFCRHELWQNLQSENIDLLLGHCRWTSFGGGPESINKNNHPHVSKDFRTALVHNGKIVEYSQLKKKYDVLTDCDSEVLLRIFESSEHQHDQIDFLKKQLPNLTDTPDDLLHRIHSLKKVFDEVEFGAMAVAIGERLEGDSRSLFLFRNSQRPITLINLTKSLGQIFFCSTPEIFREAYDSSEIAKRLIPENQPVAPLLLENRIYSFVLKDGEVKTRRFHIVKEKKYGYWDKTKEEVDDSTVFESVKLEKAPVQIISCLDDAEEPIMEPVVEDVFVDDRKYVTDELYFKGCDDEGCESTADELIEIEEAEGEEEIGEGFQIVKYPRHPTVDLEEEDLEDDEEKEIEALCEEVNDECVKADLLMSQITTHLYNGIQEGSFDKTALEDNLSAIQQIVCDLESLKCMIEM